MVRYPKIAGMDTVRGLQGGMNSSSSASVPANHVYQSNCALQVAPSRYSNVRKIVFAMCTGKLGNGTTSTCRMGIRVASTTTPALTAQMFNLPFSTVLEGTVDYGMQATQLIIPTPRGPTTTIIQTTITAGERNHAQMLQVEFDRDDAGSDLFFAEWDSFTDDDDYMLIQPIIESLTADTGAVIAYQLKNFHANILQEDDFKNNSSTDWHSYIGCNDNLEPTIAFQGAVTGPRMPFHYVAQDWNGIDSVSVVFYGSITTNTTQLTVRVFDVTDAQVVFDEIFALTIGPRYYVVRTQDFLSSLIDGHVYFVDYLLNAANSTTDPKGTGYFTIVQKNFTRTSTIHQVHDLAFTPAGGADTTPTGAIIFDPAWYSGFGVTGIREKKFVSAFAHNAGGNNPIQVVRIDADLLSLDNTRLSGTAKDMTPSHTFTGAPVSARQAFTDILTNDPLDEATIVRLQKSFPAANWISAPGDFPGHVGVYYAMTVPRSSEALSQFGSGDPAFDTDIGPI